MMMPILSESSVFPPGHALPQFSQFTLEQLPNIATMIEKKIEALQHDIEKLAPSHNMERVEEADKPDWDNFIVPLHEKTEQLFRLWGVIEHLHQVSDGPVIREQYNALLPRITAFSVALNQHVGLYQKTQDLFNSPRFLCLKPARQHYIRVQLKHYMLSGIHLTGHNRKRFLEIENRLATLSAKFSENLLDATNAFCHTTSDPEILLGLPENIIAAAQDRAQASSKRSEKYRLTLQAPDYQAVLKYAKNRSLREHFYRHYVTRASDCLPSGDPQVASVAKNTDNTSTIKEILALRQEKAALLDFDDYVSFSLASKTTKHLEPIEGFLQDLAKRARPLADAEYNELREYAKHHGMDSLEPWDVAYLQRCLCETRYAYTDDQIKPYFPEPAVMSGVFALAHDLFGVTFVSESVDVWHPQVRFYRLMDAQGQKRGGFYADLFARDSKAAGAWMDESVARGYYNQQFHQPVAYLVTNFSAPTKDTPALLTLDEVLTLLHEFGHVLHHILSEVDDLPISGIRGVEWDAVEFPSQWMEHFTWHYLILRRLSSHVHTGALLPKTLFDKAYAARHFHSGLAILRQIEFSLFDIRVHQKNADPNLFLEIWREVQQRMASIQAPRYHRFPHSFSHIFDGGYSAGYYAYLWAEVLACDGFSCFEEALKEDYALSSAFPKNPENENSFDELKATQHALSIVGQRIQREVLAMGGSRPALESFQAFRGRGPQLEALLRMRGLTEAIY